MNINRADKNTRDVTHSFFPRKRLTLQGVEFETDVFYQKKGACNLATSRHEIVDSMIIAVWVLVPLSNNKPTCSIYKRLKGCENTITLVFYNTNSTGPKSLFYCKPTSVSNFTLCNHKLYNVKLSR